MAKPYIVKLKKGYTFTVIGMTAVERAIKMPEKHNCLGTYYTLSKDTEIVKDGGNLNIFIMPGVYDYHKLFTKQQIKEIKAIYA